MDDWLEQAVSLTEKRDRITLVQSYKAALQKFLNVSGVWILAPDVPGRQLEVVDADSSPVWVVDNFDHPFSHVLRAPAPMLLTEKQLPYWQENSDFTQLVAARQPGECILITPLPPATNKIKALLMVSGSITDLSGLTINPQWQQFSILFMNCWQLLKDLWQETSNKTVLSASISTIRDKEYRRELSKALQSKLIGKSEVMHNLRKEVVIAAQSHLNVLIHGETGTGKELVANAVHESSTRSDKPFVAINCAAIPENLLESELFGHAKGAFSGADRDKKGLFAEADGGTLFLDEIGDLPLSLQAKLLRVLESRCFRPVGSKEEIKADFRLVAATHVALNKRIQEQKFRQDLYYRLEQFPITVPALRQRLDDLPELVSHFVNAYNESRNTSVTGASSSVMEWLLNHPFPGNVRELRNLIDYACALTDDKKEITKQNLLNRELESTPIILDTAAEDNIDSINLRAINDLKQAVQSFEYKIISARLEKYEGNRSKAAKSLGIPKRTLAHKCLKMEIH